MNKLIVGPEFNLTYYYSLILNTIYTCLAFSSGIPILLWIGTLTLFLQYWSFKFELLRYSKKPKNLDEKLNKKIVLAILFAVCVHLIIGIYMYGSPEIFPSSS